MCKMLGSKLILLSIPTACTGTSSLILTRFNIVQSDRGNHIGVALIAQQGWKRAAELYRCVSIDLCMKLRALLSCLSPVMSIGQHADVVMLFECT